jgi:hypothetical protein
MIKDEDFEPQTISIEDVFDSEYLEIDYIDKISLEGFEADTGYFVLLVKDLDEIDTEDLVKLGFEKIKEDLCIINNFDIDVEEKYLDKIRYNRSRKIANLDFEEIRKNRLLELLPIYERIRYLTKEVNEDFRLKKQVDFFSPSNETLNAILGLYGLVCCDSYTFSKFCYHIYQLLRESVYKKSLKKFGDYYCEVTGKSFGSEEKLKEHIKTDFLGQDNFFYQIANFRHFYIHIIEKMQIEKRNNESDKIESIQSYIKNKLSRRIGCKFDYFLIQKELLKDAIKFLEKINSFLLGEHDVNRQKRKR